MVIASIPFVNVVPSGFGRRMVRAKGLEPPHLAIPGPKPGASTNSATPARTLQGARPIARMGGGASRHGRSQRPDRRNHHVRPRVNAPTRRRNLATPPPETPATPATPGPPETPAPQAPPEPTHAPPEVNPTGPDVDVPAPPSPASDPPTTPISP